MNRTFMALINTPLLLHLGACANSPSTAEQATSANCGAATMDNTARELYGNCISEDKEQIRLEDFKVTGSEQLYVYADATNGNGSKGWEFTWGAAKNRICVETR
jgi:hypothetical protein